MSNNPNLDADARQQETGDRFPNSRWAKDLPMPIADDSFGGPWRVIHLPKQKGSVQMYAVVLQNTLGADRLAWEGRDKAIGRRVADRLNGWWEARWFPPPKPETGPAISHKGYESKRHDSPYMRTSED